MTYNPRSRTDRAALATSLIALMERSNFDKTEIAGCNEAVFSRTVPDTDDKIRVLVYTTIERGECRNVGKDAIRVCAVYKARDGRERGIASAEKRVNRVGHIDAITERVIERMREVWKATKTAEKCSCGAPKFKSKTRKDKRTGRTTGGNLVCSDFCWKSDEDLARDAARFQSRKSNYQGRRSYRGRSRQPSRANASYRSAVPAGATLPDSWAKAPLAKQVAFMMAAGDDSGDTDWDQWADDLKENG